METIVWSMNDIDTAKIIAARIMFRFCPPPHAIVRLSVVTHSTGWRPLSPRKILRGRAMRRVRRSPTLRADRTAPRASERAPILQHNGEPDYGGGDGGLA